MSMAAYVMLTRALQSFLGELLSYSFAAEVFSAIALPGVGKGCIDAALDP